jgi:hypothetical protein
MALLLSDNPLGTPAPQVPASFQPCENCSRPCVPACPVEVYGPLREPELDRCATHRLGGECATGCDVRRACCYGQSHRYGVDEESYRHAYSLFMMQRERAGLRGLLTGLLNRRK